MIKFSNYVFRKWELSKDKLYALHAWADNATPMDVRLRKDIVKQINAMLEKRGYDCIKNGTDTTLYSVNSRVCSIVIVFGNKDATIIKLKGKSGLKSLITIIECIIDDATLAHG